MRTVQRMTTALMLLLILLGGLSAFVPVVAHADNETVKIGKPIIVPDPKQPSKKG